MAVNNAKHNQSQPDDVQAAISQMWGDLSEEELRNIAGGDGNGYGRRNEEEEDGHRGRGWGAPDGDSTINSCFFGRRNR